MFANSDNGGGTDWAQKSVPQMWSMLTAHDGTAHKNLLLTWKKSADLLVDHLSRVRRYRDNLAEAWPPEKSSAAAKYLDRLDDLIKHLTETHHATVENHRALGAATSALVGARLKIESIYQAYMSNQRELDAYAQKQQTNQQVVGKYRAIAPIPPVVAQSRQLQLQLQAQSVMSTLSTDLAQAQLSLTTPNLYTPSVGDYESAPFKPQKSGTTSPREPKALDLDQSSIQLVGTSTGAKSPKIGLHAIDPTTSQLLPAASQPPAALTPGSPSPILSSTLPPTLSPSTDGIRGQLSEFTSIAIPGSAPWSTISGGSTRSPNNPAGTPGAASQNAQKALPGGLIGTPPGAATARPGTNIPGMQRVNPAGGVIGGPAGIPFGYRRQPSTRNNEASGKQWNPDNPWETEEGVDPVLMPPEKKEINPGPAIGLT